jgi:hypothetical protein
VLGKIVLDIGCKRTVEVALRRRRTFSSPRETMSMNAQKMRKVQFVELIEFVAVAEYGSLTRAAAQLGFRPLHSVRRFGSWKTLGPAPAQSDDAPCRTVARRRNAFWKDWAPLEELESALEN